MDILRRRASSSLQSVSLFAVYSYVAIVPRPRIYCILVLPFRNLAFIATPNLDNPLSLRTISSSNFGVIPEIAW
jgi:hypothetical protein